MITTLEEAKKHVHISTDKYKYVVVLECGQVHASNDEAFIQNIIDTKEVFIVKGNLIKKVQPKKSKPEKVEE